ncbi:MAG: DNA translocase FtsK, partial [Chloroflexota bacterium]
DESSEARAADARIREQVDIIEQTLASFGAPSRVVEVNPGPVITQYGVEPQYIQQRNGRRVKVKVGRITSLADDLALALAARSIRIEAPVPGKGYVGIEVPNSEPTNVNLRDVMESDAFESIDSALRIALGHNVSGSSVAVDLTHMPHLLIAGTTGSGKSVCINSLATCLLLNNTPDQLRFLMVDPKRVELTGYNGIPHLLTPVIVDLNKVVGTLQWVLREMDSRYLKFAEAGARNIADYNQHLTSNGNKKLPYIVVIIDELADLMLMAPEDTERTVCRLAQMARATGIHLIIATQRPSVDVVTGLIKANFPARIAFAVTSSTDSRVILDTTGAERLLGRGDMLLMAPDSAQPSRMQGCNVAEHELRRLVEFWRRQRLDAVEAGKQERAAKKDDEPEKEPPKQQPLWEEIIELEEQEQAKDQDELYDQAVETVRSIGKASVSLLQRRLRIGYTRAARLIDEMEERGIVGPHPGGSRQRQVLPATDDVEPEPE